MVKEMRLGNTWLLQSPRGFVQWNFTKTKENVDTTPGFTDQTLVFWGGLIHNGFKPFYDDI